MTNRSIRLYIEKAYPFPGGLQIIGVCTDEDIYVGDHFNLVAAYRSHRLREAHDADYFVCGMIWFNRPVDRIDHGHEGEFILLGGSKRPIRNSDPASVDILLTKEYYMQDERPADQYYQKWLKGSSGFSARDSKD